MSAAIAGLMAEHRVIERVLDGFERFAERVLAGGDPADLGDYVAFCRRYTDGLHHGKEEDVLFAVLIEEQLFPADLGPVACMLGEHDVGRRAVADLADLADLGALDPTDRRRLFDLVCGYAAMLRLHIAKEDQVLYPVAAARLAPRALAEVDRSCAIADAEAEADARELVALAERLGR